MDENNINSWLAKARANDKEMPNESGVQSSSGVRVVSKSSKSSNASEKQQKQQSRGALIMEIAEKIRPVFQNFFAGRRDDNGMLFQPAHIRGFTLNCAEYLVKAKEQDNNAAA